MFDLVIVVAANFPVNTWYNFSKLWFSENSKLATIFSLCTQKTHHRIRFRDHDHRVQSCVGMQRHVRHDWSPKVPINGQRGGKKGDRKGEQWQSDAVKTTNKQNNTQKTNPPTKTPSSVNRSTWPRRGVDEERRPINGVLHEKRCDVLATSWRRRSPRSNNGRQPSLKKGNRVE